MIYQIIAFIIISICAIQVIIKEHEIGILNRVLYQIDEKTLMPFLEDIKIVQGQNPVCPSDYPFYISQYQWAGTIEGCFCHEGGLDNQKCCSSGSCKTFTCEGQDVNPTQAQNLNFWTNSQNGNKNLICGKKMEEISAKSQTILLDEKSALCKDKKNYKLCQSENQFDDFNVCVPKNMQCPIREMKIVNESEKLDLEISRTESDLEFHKIEENQYLLVNRYANQLPIIDFRTDDNLQICFNEDEQIEEEENQRDYYLLLNKQKREVDSCIQNINWKKMTTVTKNKLYQANTDFYENTIQKLPLYKLHDHDVLHLLYLNAQPIKFQLQDRWINGQSFDSEISNTKQNYNNNNLRQISTEKKENIFFSSFNKNLKEIKNMGLPQIIWNVEMLEKIIFTFKIFIFVLIFQVVETPLKTEKLFRFQYTNYQRLKKLFQIARVGLKFIVINMLMYLVIKYQYHVFFVDQIISDLKNQNGFIHDQGMCHYLEDFQTKNFNIYKNKFIIAMFVMGYIFESNLIKIIYRISCFQQQNTINHFIKDELELNQLTHIKNNISDGGNHDLQCQSIQMSIQLINASKQNQELQEISKA